MAIRFACDKCGQYMEAAESSITAQCTRCDHGMIIPKQSTLPASVHIPKPSNESMRFCPACGKEVSRKAKACPHCGEPVRRNRAGLLLWVWFLVLTLFVVGIGTTLGGEIVDSALGGVIGAIVALAIMGLIAAKEMF